MKTEVSGKWSPIQQIYLLTLCMHSATVLSLQRTAEASLTWLDGSHQQSVKQASNIRCKDTVAYDSNALSVSSVSDRSCKRQHPSCQGAKWRQHKTGVINAIKDQRMFGLPTTHRSLISACYPNRLSVTGRC